MKALVNKKENGRVCEVLPDDKIFETYSDLVWIDCTGTDIENEKPNEPNGGTWTYSFETETFSIVPPHTNPAERFNIARKIGYGEIGEQLDMLYKEVKDAGSITTDGEWFKHVKKVKKDVTLDNT
tara:strand:- start:5791 stop:6165 length:375 start_codon:yes stop_codon:yes gene_type:complete